MVKDINLKLDKYNVAISISSEELTAAILSVITAKIWNKAGQSARYKRVWELRTRK